MLVPKGFLRLQGIGRDTEDRGLILRERARQSREVDGLLGAARRVRARIEKQHQFLAGVVLKGDGAATVTRQAERRRLCTLGQG